MKISFYINGLDSLKKGFDFFREYEKMKYYDEDNTNDRFFKLKDAILSIHHGIEILIKHLLIKENEFLIIAQVDNKVKKAYQEKNKKKLSSIFETSLREEIHTVSFREAIDRLVKICGYNIPATLIKNLEKLEKYRNQIMHSEIFSNEDEISNIFDNFLYELDIFFYNSMGEGYKTLSGYSDMVKSFDEYKEYLLKNNLKVKADFIEFLIGIFQEKGISMGEYDVSRILDINTVDDIFKRIFESKFKFGVDLYNNFCSGEVNTIKRMDKERFMIYTDDNASGYIFKFKSLIIGLTKLSDSFTPLFFLESENDIVEPHNDKFVKKTINNINYIVGLYNKEKNEIVYNDEYLNYYYGNYSEEDDDILSFNRAEYFDVYKFLSGGLFCFLNVQYLEYGGFDRLPYQSLGLGGKQVEVLLRNTLINQKEAGLRNN